MFELVFERLNSICNTIDMTQNVLTLKYQIEELINMESFVSLQQQIMTNQNEMINDEYWIID